MEITIVETTVGEVAGIRVGVASVIEEEFVLDNGEPQRAPRATLAVMGDTPETDFDARVHAGMVVTIAEHAVVVTDVRAPANALGSVTLRVD